MSEEDPKERRRRRSEETQQALTYQLEHLVETFDELYLMLLADDQGVIVARAGDRELAQLLAAHARSLAVGDRPDPELSIGVPDLTAEQILCEAIDLDEIPLYLCAIMEPTPENAEAFQRARDGIQRIYYNTSELAGDSD